MQRYTRLALISLALKPTHRHLSPADFLCVGEAKTRSNTSDGLKGRVSLNHTVFTYIWKYTNSL